MPAVKRKLVAIRFKLPYGVYKGGDRAGFTAHRAEALVKSGAAVYAKKKGEDDQPENSLPPKPGGEPKAEAEKPSKDSKPPADNSDASKGQKSKKRGFFGKK